MSVFVAVFNPQNQVMLCLRKDGIWDVPSCECADSKAQESVAKAVYDAAHIQTSGFMNEGAAGSNKFVAVHTRETPRPKGDFVRCMFVSHVPEHVLRVLSVGAREALKKVGILHPSEQKFGRVGVTMEQVLDHEINRRGA